MMIDILELPESKRIIEAAEARIFANTGIKVKLIGHLENMEHELEFKKLLLKKIVCEVFYIKWDDVLSKKRERKVCSARFVYMYLLRKYFNESYKNIAIQLSRDHTSVIHAITSVNNWYDINDDIVTHIETVKQKYNDALL